MTETTIIRSFSFLTAESDDEVKAFIGLEKNGGQSFGISSFQARKWCLAVGYSERYKSKKRTWNFAFKSA